MSLLVISGSDADQWGCPSCGYRSGSTPLSAQGACIWNCGDCQAACMILHDDLRVVPDSWTQLKGQPVGQHPREGIPKHGRPDQRPEGGGDYFRSRGVGMDHTPGCFVCGGAPGFYSNIAAFVQCRAAGERVVAMFTQGARLDYREFEPDRIQVKIGACEEHLPNLRVLDQLAGVITTEALALAMRPLPA